MFFFFSVSNNSFVSPPIPEDCIYIKKAFSADDVNSQIPSHQKMHDEKAVWNWTPICTDLAVQRQKILDILGKDDSFFERLRALNSSWQKKKYKVQRKQASSLQTSVPVATSEEQHPPDILNREEVQHQYRSENEELDIDFF